MITLLFIIGSVLAVSSFALKNVFHLRIASSLACSLFIAYYGLKPEVDYNPIILNGTIIVINMFYIIKMYGNRTEWKALQRYKRIHRKRKEEREDAEDNS